MERETTCVLFGNKEKCKIALGQIVDVYSEYISELSFFTRIVIILCTSTKIKVSKTIRGLQATALLVPNKLTSKTQEIQGHNGYPKPDRQHGLF